MVEYFERKKEKRGKKRTDHDKQTGRYIPLEKFFIRTRTEYHETSHKQHGKTSWNWMSGKRRKRSGKDYGAKARQSMICESKKNGYQRKETRQIIWCRGIERLEWIDESE